jgi:CHRD domain-containing protein
MTLSSVDGHRRKGATTMGRKVLMAAAVLFVIGTGARAQAQVIHMSATLTGGNETPPILTGAYATATVEVDMGARTVTWNIDVFNLPSGINNAHFHVAPVGIAGPTVVNIPFPANASNEFNLSGSATAANLNVRGDQGIRSWDDFLQSLVGGQTYLNIHTNVNGGGEIRGQVLRNP